MAKRKYNGAPIRVAVLDILKPHKPNILEFGQLLCKERSVDNVNISVYAIDEKTESLKVVLEGKKINFDNVEKLVRDHGAVIHSVDKAIIGKEVVIKVPVGKSIHEV